MVQHCRLYRFFLPPIDFNTSYVMVQLNFYFFLSFEGLISIHLMLWFNGKTCDCSIILNFISIHLMLWFNHIFTTFRFCCMLFQYILCYGSTTSMPFPASPFTTFQYILCYGSTLDTSNRNKVLNTNFNTSYVMVQQKTT